MADEILIVDDEADIRSLISEALQDEGYTTREAPDSVSALSTIAIRRPSLILLDIWLQGSPLDGLQILNEVKMIFSDIPIVMMSGHGTIESAVSAIKDGAYDFIEKPFKTDRLLLQIERAIEAARTKRELAELKLRSESSSKLVGTSSSIREIRQVIEKAGRTNSRILISGPPGSGKEVVARMLHTQSSRSGGPFIVVNCAAMLPDHMETELFGEEGAENSSRPKKIGLFEQAHTGTLLLDEVSDMPLETQGKIVRTLQDQIFTRVGGSKRVETDVRVIATATQNLNEQIKLGQFREDLFYRLNVVPIQLPPLSERMDDVPELAEYFLLRASEISGQPKRCLSADATVALQGYNWPGNVREFRNVIERLLIMTPGSVNEPIGVTMLPPEIVSGTPDINATRNLEIMGMPLRTAREVFEKEYLLAQLNRHRSNVSQTAKFVGMERSALHRKLKSLGVKIDSK
ncbi:MAG: sigma-54-dependent Fis family transcriptional regulator [Magnetovibrio sp.]|nr:sigma-54-dependent Fis family transcriptional regulator [Magnetovibrio sp.]